MKRETLMLILVTIMLVLALAVGLMEMAYDGITEEPHIEQVQP